MKDKFRIMRYQHSYDHRRLDKAKLKQEKINKCQKILKEILFNFLFIWVLLALSYSNRNASAFYYQSSISTTFSGFKNVILILI